MAMQKEGTTEKDARAKIWMVDSKGLIVKDRPEGGLNAQKLMFAQNHAPIKTLAEVVKTVKPSVLIGNYFLNFNIKEKNIRYIYPNYTHPINFFSLRSFI